jgi:DNA-binding response OmpR family regulator
MRLLLIEDEDKIVTAVRGVLQDAGYVVEVAVDGVSGAFWLLEDRFDAVILDLGLPGKAGMDVLREARGKGDLTPVLILTARDSWQERVDGLKAGADDYLGKPFYPEELKARLEAIIRRQNGNASNKLSVAGLQLDTDGQKVEDQQGREYQLTGIEFRLLRYLMLNPDKIISKSELSEHVYEEDNIRDSNVIEVYINKIRQRFGKAFIATHRGQGYRLNSSGRRYE